MSKQTELLQLDRCIVSRLWYTAMTIHQRELSDRCRHRRDVKKLKHLIETCAEQGSCEYKWIAYNLSSQIENDEDSRKSLIHEEFVSTLKLLDALVPHHTQEELLRLFKAIRTAGEKTDVPTCQLSQESIQCLEDNMMKYPTLIHWIINGLLCLWLPTSFAQTDLVLQDVYFSCLKRLLQEFLVDAIMDKDETTISLSFQKKNNVLKNEHLSILVSILSKVDLTDAKEDEMLAWLYPTLLESTNSDYIELALYSRKNPKFFKAWHQFLDDTYARCNNPDNLENALKISRLMFTFDEHSIISLNANEIFKGVLRRRSHWLMDILDICYEILMSKRYNEVEQILNTPVLKDFWLLLLFKLLNDCQSALIFPIVEKCEDSTAICRALSFVLEKSKIKSRNEPTLQRLNNNLENHLKVLDWILEDKKLASTSDSISSKVAYPNFSVKQTLNFLDSHSTLAVLKMTTNIHEKSYNDIQILLNDTDNSKNVFQAYYTMLCALKAILICEFYNTKYQQVAGHFDDMEKSLGSLFPLDLRLEVIENIFSMMFLRYEDFVETDSGSDIGEEDSQTKPTESATKKKDSISSATGFVCNKYATREILIRLKRSITTVELECAEQKRDRKLSIETCDQIQNSVALVSKCISDAIWRLELLTSAEFIDRRGMPDTDNPRMSLSYDTSLFVDRRFHYATNTKIKTIFYKPNESSSDESEVLKSDFDGSSEAGSQGNATNNSSRRRKRSKNQSLLTETSSMTSRDSKKRERTLNCMLVSKKSLVMQCLWKSDYERASQVIKMFGLKNSPLDGEILFSRAMRGFRKELRAQWKNSDTVDSSDLPTKPSTLENIRRAVHGGFQSSRTTGQIETFLAAQESSARLLNSNSITAKEILTMAAMDLALTMSRTYQDSVNLSDVAMKYMKSCKKLAKTRYYSFFESVYQLIYENKPELSMNEILCDARIPLSVTEAREKNGYWSNLMKKLEILRQSECQYESDIDASINENTSDPRERIFEDVISICENGEFYLPRVHAHLKILRTIVPEDKETLVEHSQLLETDLHTYIGDQIFRLNVELDEIESIASRLQVNLVHSILVNCCPKLSCFNGVSYNDVETRGTRVLNKNWMEDPSERNSYEPNQCVMEILSELIGVLRSKLSPARVTLQYQEAGELSDDMEIHNILEKTGRLATLDLSNLSFGHHTLAFFINVWNLLMIHAMLEIWSKDPPIDELRHEISLEAIGYDIGDLGTVSLSTLRSKLLGQSTFHDSRYFPQTEELNEPAWQDLDVPHEPKVIFAMINEYEDSPIVRVYGRKTLDDDLKTAMSDYLEHHVTRQANLKLTNDRVVHVPKLVQRYGDLMAKRSNSSSSSSVPVPLEEIMDDLNIPKIDARVSIKPSRCSYKIHFSYINDESVRSEEVCKIVGTANDEFPWQSRIVTPNLLQYLEGHCWLLSYLVQRIHEESPTIHDSNCENLGRTAALENLLKSSWASNLKCLYENNQIVAGLWKIALTNDVWLKFETLLKNDEITKCLEIVNALPDSLIANNIEIQRFKDKILAKLANASRDQSINETMKCIYRIKDEQTLAQVILTNVNDLPVKVCQEALAHVLSYRNKEKLPSHCKSRMNEILCRLTVFRKMLPYCAKKSDEDDDSWHDVVYQTEKTNPMRIVRSLIDANQYELCLEWLEYQAVSSEIHSLITQDLLVGLLTNDDHDFKHALKLLRALPAKKSINLCNGVIVKLESISALRFVVGYLLEHTSPNESERYRRGLLGIDILEQLEIKERRSYIHLIEQPLLMLEQLLMNCRLDNLQRIVVAIREEPNNSLFCSESFDEIVRFYSKKSLDFRVAVQGDAMERIKEVSVSSTKRESGVFVMPLDIPTKEEWVPNDKARECSCCHVVIFSMFNRRHHCRRCGRVVCANCSPQRMRLPTYPNSVPVRICNDCKRQTLVQMQQAQGAPSTPSSETFDCWRLNVDEAHNKTLRDEFSFEHAPNISLCLAILNLHSDHEAYSNFLLDRCDEMKDLLRPDSKGRVNPEIDHGLIIKMIRSLLVAAKVKCAKLGLNTGLAHCDRFLSQVDLITTLVNSDCSYLIPRTGKDDHLDDHTLRRLRDSLTEKEQWIIALDVSTKTGLDSQGVWAAWGTACLKVGYYEQARDKFTHCLEKVLREDSDDWVMLSYPGESGVKRDSWSLPSDNIRRRTISSKSQEGLKNRPVKDPPLLTEILQILERTNPNTMYGNYGLKSKAGSTQDIMNTLNRLKNLTEEYNTIGQPTVCTKDVRYEESLYYLLMYGSFSSILEFFIRHGKYEICLAYILENDIDPELFMNSVFLRCLRTGTMANLCEAMRAKDSNLVAFKKYLMFTCHSLERKQLLHTLLQLQLFMKDYVRASMTCIRFYVTDAKTYEDLCSRTHHLVEAQKHLESELQLESFGKKRRKSVSSSYSGQYSLTLEMHPIEIDRHMNTISRQMEIAKFLGNRQQEGKLLSEFMNTLAYMDSEGNSTRTVPTLFGNQQEKSHLAVLAILCGHDVEEGFGIAFRIMQDYNLRPQKIYSLVGHILALNRQISSIEQLIKCCRSSGAPNSNAISDRVLAHCVKLLLDLSRADPNPSPKDQIDALIRIITDVELKIESYIESRQLKAAYLLAVKHSRAQDIRKILKEADRLGQLAIKSICTKWLQQTQKSKNELG